MHGRQSGLEGELRYSGIATYHEGRAILIELFLEHEQALKALEMCE